MMQSQHFNWANVDRADNDDILNEEHFEGPKYFGCIRMVTKRFLHLLFLIELIFLSNEVRHLIKECNRREYDDVFIVDLAHAILYFVVLMVISYIIYKYHEYDKTCEFIGMERNMSFLRLCQTYVALFAFRIIVQIIFYITFIFSVKPLCRYSMLNDYHFSAKSTLEFHDESTHNHICKELTTFGVLTALLIAVLSVWWQAYILICFIRIKE